MRHIGKLLLFLFLIFAGSCQQSKNSAHISGRISDANGMSLYVDEFGYGSPISAIDKIQLDADGKFSHDFETKLSPGIYRFRIGSNQFIGIVDDELAQIEINGTLSDLNAYSLNIEGMPQTKVLNNWMNGIIKKEIKINDLKSEISNENPALAEMVAVVEGSRYLNEEGMLELYSLAGEQLDKDMPKSKYSKQLEKMSTTLKAKIRERKMSARTEIGAIPPPIEQKDPNGNIISLDDVKGKVVLLDFWASWCKPCRIANPMVVDLYNKYNKKGFEVFNVSLDKNKSSWANAIKQDKLNWKYHVSDLQGWKSMHAKDYNVTSIPRTFLLDREGKIAALNIRDKRKLEEKIKELL